MRRKRLSWMVPMVLVLASCAHNSAPVQAPVPSRVEPRPGGDQVDPLTPERACAFGVVSEACLATPFNRMRHDSAASAFAHGLMALNAAGIKRFATDHPTWDGRGVLVAILDSGIDPGIPGLAIAADGSPKVLDLRDFSDEGRVHLQPAIRRGDTLLVGDRRVLGAARIAALSGDAPIWGGTIAELTLGKAPAADLNGNGTVNDTLLVVVANTPSGWALFADTDGDGTLANERPVHDYLVARELFGWYQHAGTDPKRGATPLNIAVNLADSAGVPVLDLFFDTSSHGSHVTGIAAGHNLYGVAGFDGVAPGAKVIGLKIANDANGGVTVTGSMVRALDYAIRFANERSMPLVVNLSFGVGNEHEGTARIDAMIDSILAAHPDVVMTVAAGNDGPGLSSLGFPGSASRIISVGATMPPASTGAGVDDAGAGSIAAFSSRGGELAGPDVVLPGVAYSTVPNYAIGDELETGTSMASPYGAGLAARLLSALRASGRAAPARIIRQGLRMAARPFSSGATLDQGAGLPDLTRAWQWLAESHDFAGIAVDVGQVSGRGAVYLTASGDAANARALGARVVLRRLDGTAPLTLHLRGDAAWLQFPETITLAAGRGEFTVGVQPGAAVAPGLSSATIRVEGPDETAGPLAVIPVVVRTPVPASGTRAPVNVNVTAGGIGRVFVPADSGRGLQIEVATLTASDRAIAALHEPGGMPFRDSRSIPAGSGEGAGLFDIGAEDAVGGIYEVDVVAGPLTPMAGRVTVRQAPLRLGATMVRDTLRVTAKSLVATTLSVRLRAGLIGAERRITVQRDGDAPVRVAIPVPMWAARVVVDTRMPPEEWSRFTDFGLSFFDRRGHEFDTSPINYAFSRATPELPDSIAGDTMVVLLSPGFADPREHGRWSIELSVRFYVEKPYALDGDGSPVRPVAAAALREERFVQAPMPIQFPPGFFPLVTVVALEGTDHIWTREVTPTKPAGTP